MHSVTFDKSGTSVTIDGTIVYNADSFSDNKNNQYAKRNLNGNLITYSTGNTICNGLLVMNNVSHTDYKLLETWIKDTIVFMQYTFTLSEAGSDVDLGKGAGVSLTSVRFTETDLNGVFKYEAPGVYVLKFPYRFIRV